MRPQGTLVVEYTYTPAARDESGLDLNALALIVDPVDGTMIPAPLPVSKMPQAPHVQSRHPAPIPAFFRRILYT